MDNVIAKMFKAAAKVAADRKDMSSIECAIRVGLDRKVIEKEYRKGRSDEEYKALYEKAYKSYMKWRIDCAKKNFEEAVERCLKEGITISDMLNLLEKKISKSDSLGE